MKYEVGTMIEIPRAALTADDIASEAEFFCFGTNDLTQMTFGLTRQVLASLWKWLLKKERKYAQHSTVVSVESTAETLHQ